MSDIRQAIELLIKLTVENKEALNKLTQDTEKTTAALKKSSEASDIAAKSAGGFADQLGSVAALSGTALASVTTFAAGLGGLLSILENAAEKVAKLEEKLQNVTASSGATRENFVGLT